MMNAQTALSPPGSLKEENKKTSEISEVNKKKVSMKGRRLEKRGLCTEHARTNRWEGDRFNPSLLCEVHRFHHTALEGLENEKQERQ